MPKQPELHALTIQTDFKAPKGYAAHFQVLSLNRVRIVLKKQPSDPFKGAGDWTPTLPSQEGGSSGKA